MQTGINRTTVADVATKALDMKTDRMGTADQRRIVAILSLLGWTQQRNKFERWWERR
jgi:hypothetical protein